MTGSILAGLLSFVFSSPGQGLDQSQVYVGILLCLSIAAPAIKDTLIVLIVSPLLILCFVLNFVLRCLGKDPMPLDFLKDLLPWSNRKAKDLKKQKKQPPSK